MLLPTNSSKGGKKDDQCLTCYLWCLPSVYDIVTCSQQKIKDFFLGGEGLLGMWPHVPVVSSVVMVVT